METKKSDHANLEKKRSMFFQVGLLFALGLAFVAFEWQVELRISDVEWETAFPVDGITIEIPVTRPDLPPPMPPPPSLELVIVDNTIDIGDISEILIDVGEGFNLLPTDIFTRTSLQEEVEPEIFDHSMLEEQALFNGKPAEEAFRSYIGQHLKYPQIAVENGIFGRVFVQFVVDQKGNVVDVQVVRSVDPSLDNEALRLIKTTSGLWSPGKQHGKPVKVRYTFPIVFQLRAQ